ncbi:MAG: hypothetical protein WCB27_12515 [Thermoguttaceae bacterium]
MATPVGRQDLLGRVCWTLQLLAEKLVEREIVKSIGREAVRTTLKKRS